MQPENEKYQCFGGVLMKKRVLVNQNRCCSKSETLVNIVLTKIYGPISAFKKWNRETEGKQN